MNIINFKPLFPIKSFSEMAYDQQKISEEEINLSLKLIPKTWTPAHEQTQSIFLQVFPREVKDKIFNLLDTYDLKSCLLVCKEFSQLAKPIYVQKALLAISQNFKKVESDINLLLNDAVSKVQFENSCYRERANSLSSPTLPNTQSPMLSDKLDVASRKLTLFKTQCAFLYNNSEITKERLKVMDILKSTMQLLKACIQLRPPQENTQVNSSSINERMKDILQRVFYKQ